MTLVEFLAPLSKNKNQDRILAVLYYADRYEQRPSMTVDAIRQKLKTARVNGSIKLNIADVLSKSGALVDTDGLDGKKRLWKLTNSGQGYVRDVVGLPVAEPEIEHDVTTLTNLVLKISDEDIRQYLEEALKCLQVGAIRACIVFVWTAAIRTIQASMLTNGAAAVTTVIQRHDPKAKAISTLDDFAYVKDATTLLAAKDLGFFDKNEKDTLTEALNLRNRCGHPSKYRPGLKKSSAFVEDITSIVFS
ncbi:MAG: hypothetical protein ACOZAA_01250 [Pseudomonadota bacterium]